MFFLNKVFVSPMNSAQNPLNSASCPLKRVHKIKKKKKKQQQQQQQQQRQNANVIQMGIKDTHYLFLRVK